MKLSLTVTVVLLATSALAASSPPGKQPTERFRKEHVEIKEHLEHLDTMVGSLATQSPAEQKKTTGFVVKFLTEHIVAHAKWEEARLYPVVDRQAKSGAQPFTASMRYEHRIIERWIGELKAESAKASPDAMAFSRGAHRVLGLISAHFEEEEEVLLPILDASMTAEQFERELGEH